MLLHLLFAFNIHVIAMLVLCTIYTVQEGQFFYWRGCTVGETSKVNNFKFIYLNIYYLYYVLGAGKVGSLFYRLSILPKLKTVDENVYNFVDCWYTIRPLNFRFVDKTFPIKICRLSMFLAAWAAHRPVQSQTYSHTCIQTLSF